MGRQLEEEESELAGLSCEAAGLQDGLGPGETARAAAWAESAQDR